MEYTHEYRLLVELVIYGIQAQLHLIYERSMVGCFRAVLQEGRRALGSFGIQLEGK